MKSNSDIPLRSAALKSILVLLALPGVCLAKGGRGIFPLVLEPWKPVIDLQTRATDSPPQIVEKPCAAHDEPAHHPEEGFSLTVNVFGQPRFFVFLDKNGKNRRGPAEFLDEPEACAKPGYEQPLPAPGQEPRQSAFNELSNTRRG